MSNYYMRESAELQVSRLSSGTLAVIQREIEGEGEGEVTYKGLENLRLDLLQQAHGMPGAETWQEVVRRYKGWKLIRV